MHVVSAVSRIEVDMLSFDRAPEALDESIVRGAASAIAADVVASLDLIRSLLLVN
jgi:hypothetical protein